MRLYYKAWENETLQYVDVMRLYPYICKYFKFPVGHPVIHVGDACRDKEPCPCMADVIKCSIVPPERYHPVLPFRCNNELSSEECGHTENEERALTGTWLMDEVSLAVEKGYRVLQIYEMYEYQVTQYNPETGKGEFSSTT